MTRNIGTPFNDSLSLYQIKLKEESSKERKIIFIDGMVLSSLLLLI